MPDLRAMKTYQNSKEPSAGESPNRRQNRVVSRRISASAKMMRTISDATPLASATGPIGSTAHNVQEVASSHEEARCAGGRDHRDVVFSN